MAIVLMATGVFVHQRLASNLDRAVDRSLTARSADVAALAQQSESGLREARAGARTGRADYAQLVDGRGQLLDRSRNAPSRPLLFPQELTAARSGPPLLMDRRTENGRGAVRLLATSVRAQGQTLVIIVGQSLEERNRALDDLAGVLTIGGPAALLLASLAGFLLTGAALRPVEAMRRRTAAISATDLDERLEPPASNDELGRLGRTLNEMLARIQAAVARERTFVSDASHELRSPLAMLRTELELIARDRPSGAALQSAVGSAVDETDRLGRLADDLLLLARADEHGLVVAPQPVSVTELLSSAAARGRRQARTDGRVIVVGAVPHELRVLIEPDRAAQALGNLIDNAVRHATGRVELTARDCGAVVELHVIDDGPGFPADFLPHAFTRFARADAGRTEDGAGVGLAIVRAIAEAHGGTTGATNAPGGGADTWLALPQASVGRPPSERMR